MISGRFLGRRDPVLILALILAMAFSLYGLRWGRVECWNRDQMALRDLHGWFPYSYEKPPLHTYLNHLLVLAPITQAEHLLASISGKPVNLNEARLIGSRLLVLAMFLASIVLLYSVSREAFGLAVARATALFLATSAGFVAFNHFLSCDSPLLFFMILSFYLGLRVYSSGRLREYLFAGTAVGFCTAMKYNGLAAGIVMMVAHAFSVRSWSPRKLLFDPRLLAGLALIPIAFLIGNPGAIFDHERFLSDYIYNAKVTPYYNGVTGGHGYLSFLRSLPELLGWPGAVLLGLGAIASLAFVRRRDYPIQGAVCFYAASGVFLLYFLVIGSFPRIEARFVLPVAPFLILIAGPLLQQLLVRPWALALFLPIFAYNCVCSAAVGKRFVHDPRTDAQVWVQRHFHRDLVMESSAESPRWAKMPGLNFQEISAGLPAPATGAIDWRMPYAYGRLSLFRKIFQNDRWMQEHVAQHEIEGDESLFTAARLQRRHPKFVAIYSSDYQVPSEAVRRYYLDLLEGKSGYRINFDGATAAPPRWSYPQRIDFLAGRMTILTREAE